MNAPVRTQWQPHTEGVFFDLPEETYRSAPGENISAIKNLARSPAHYRASRDRKTEPTPAMVFGTLLHAAMLEPGKCNYVVRPECLSFQTKEGKAWRDSQTLPILTIEDDANIRCAAQALHAHPTVKAILGKAEKRAKEVAVFKKHPETGLLLKGRLDILTEDNDDNTVVVDIKTTDDASPGAFSRTMAKYGYDQQAAHYLDLLNAVFFVFIAVEKTAPYGVGVYSLDNESIEIGRQRNEEHYRLLAKCKAEDSWPGYNTEVQTISLPRWAKFTTPTE